MSFAAGFVVGQAIGFGGASGGGGGGAADGDSTNWGTYANQAAFSGIDNPRTGDLAYSTADVATYRWSGSVWQFIGTVAGASWDGSTAGQLLTSLPESNVYPGAIVTFTGDNLQFGTVTYSTAYGWIRFLINPFPVPVVMTATALEVVTNP